MEDPDVNAPSRFGIGTFQSVWVRDAGTWRVMFDGGGPPPEPATFDIRDGAKLVRAGLADILAVSSAGNYAEFHLADGRKPLMRASLASLVSGLNALAFHLTIDRHRADWNNAPVPPVAARLAGGLSLMLWLSVIAAGRMFAYDL